ncbi:LacI family DNA-binding transcriptional regulator [Sinanaerobacter chloroacetimidivorans]|uniref:LacI family DNA-binding transcriptional regulator n=1 Tax=Sinanaerobacter chloroacetimidivorans TaxID=2818044 RepID=A0A8J7W3Y4_9FIRM|nr:LacI family DNA-binding transcriptional regulator [Sinanaerobacter chloroacetimidivorans]MBR0600462.1 LacI family DNA-binding transcriptional regulator [Sinanaerobacter chloroacetimidivorans]
MIPINITIKDVAKELGVSYSSISRALNGKEGVSEATRQKILKTAEKMGYQPNDLARGLVNKISKTVGVIIPDINNPFFGEIVTGISDAANEKEYNIFLCISGWSPKNEQAYFDTLRKKRVDGIILKSAGKNEDYENVRSPLMIIERYSKTLEYNCVEVDNELGGYLAAKHLLDCDYRNLGFILGKEDIFASQSRLNGAARALKEYGMSINENAVIEGSFSIEGGRMAAKELFENRGEKIDAVFSMNDLIGLGVLQYCSDQNISVPDEVGVIGYDNISYSRLPQIQLTTIHQPKYELGRMLFDTLLEEIQAKDEPKQVKKVILNPELKIRKTTRVLK